MAACRSLQHIFETPLPAENPTLLDSFSSWNQIQPVKPIQNSSFTEIFGEHHFNDNSPLSTSSPPVSTSCSSSLVNFDSQPKISGECNDNKNEAINQKAQYQRKYLFQALHQRPTTTALTKAVIAFLQ
ncbi:hypothetical protein M0R45_015670 [Rubus argutus]|uniref:Uncharacterized protein n=1 Tax=Rubus argutus TaxID=59490 RepID=A0AAW1XQA6_RUBAR